MTVPRSQQGRIRAGTLAGSIMLFMALSGLCLFLAAAPGAGVSSQSRMWAGPWGSFPAKQQAGIKLQRGVILSWMTRQLVLAADTEGSHRTFWSCCFAKTPWPNFVLSPSMDLSPSALPTALGHKVTSCPRPTSDNMTSVGPV